MNYTVFEWTESTFTEYWYYSLVHFRAFSQNIKSGMWNYKSTINSSFLCDIKIRVMDMVFAHFTAIRRISNKESNKKAFSETNSNCSKWHTMNDVCFYFFNSSNENMRARTSWWDWKQEKFHVKSQAKLIFRERSLAWLASAFTQTSTQ